MWYDVTGVEKARTFTDAHEASTTDRIRRDMDLKNNEKGFACFKSWASFSEAQIKTRTEQYIDDGMAWRLEDVGSVLTLVPTSNSEKR